LLLVDGYNASMAAWPGVDIATQRQRLLPALAGLAARTGAAVHVVFDGSDDAPGPVAGEARSNVRVTFSPPDVEADEVIIRLVGSIPPLRPVVVATSDRRVREEVTRVGANAISTPQLLSLLGRHTPRG
jgi:predicted RNA-binding protein with PIN domain